MATEIVCERCGVDDHLTGTRRDDDLIELHCSMCDVTFTRDPRPSCSKCGGFEMEAMPQVIVEKSRGSQMSIQGVHREFLCRVCDVEIIREKRDVHLPNRLRGSQ
jgi:hypothetical protein